MRSSMRSVQAILAILALLVAVPLSAGAQATTGSVQTQPSSVAQESPWELVGSLGTVYALDMVDANDGWTGGIGGKMFHYDGAEWQPWLTDFDPPIRGLGMVNSSSGWGVTYKGQAIRYASGAWSMYGAISGAPLNDVIMLAEDNGWAVGGVDPGTEQGTILHYNGWSWDKVSSNVSYWLQAIDMVSPTDGWVVGAGGMMLHWNGVGWSVASYGAQYVFYDVDMVSANDVWIVGAGGIILHYDGVSVAEVPSPTTRDLTGVSMAAADDGWAIGKLGTILHYDGGQWQTVPSPTTMSLNAIEMVSANEGWIVGSGVLLRYLGAPDPSTSTHTVTPTRADYGDTLSFSVNVINSGTAVLPSVRVTDTLSLDLNLLPVTVATSQGTVVGTDPIIVDVGDVAPGGDVSITFQAQVDPAGSGCRIVRSEALIGSSGEQLSRQASALVSEGDCEQNYLPLTIR